MSNIFPDAGCDLLRAQLELSVSRAERLSGQLRGAEFERDLIKSKLSALVERAESTVFQGLTKDQPAKLIPSESLRGNLINLRAAIAAARGGAS